MKKMYRPIGVKELDLILNTGCRRYPPRLPTQPIFYPVLNQEYAIEIAQKWNTKDNNSGFCGYVTEFNIDKHYVSKYETHIVGSSKHEELWVPAELLSEFNSYIQAPILISNAFYGERYEAIENHIEKFIQLLELKKYNPMDFSCQVQAEWKMVTHHYMAWVKHDFNNYVCDYDKANLLSSLRKTLVDNMKWFFTF